VEALKAKPRPPLVEIVVPVHNEEHVLARNITRLQRHLTARFPFAWRITIADNASTDATHAVALDLARRLDGVRAVHLMEKGRGRALRRVWAASDADVLAYMDVDLSTGLDALLPLVAPLVSGHSDLAIGTRLAAGSRVTRSARRELISRGYNRILRTAFRTRFTDAQCGFKAGRAGAVRWLLAGVEDQGWFFDTELLMLAERSGMRIHEVPVDWTEDPDSRVDVVSTALGDLRGLARVASDRVRGLEPVRTREPLGLTSQLLRFGAIGVASTVLYALLYLAMRGVAGAWPANAIALALSAVANTAANRRLTFGRSGRRDAVRHHVQGLAVFALCLGLTTGTLALLDLFAPQASTAVELLALCAANALGTVLRFVALRLWVFGPRQRPAERGQAQPLPPALPARAVSR
jgi:putative flippase GtrA/glycosyltransferase involved in cell wall biosynthesis